MHQPLLHEVLNDIISGMTFPVTFTSSTDNGNGTFTLSGIKNIHHVQPGFSVTIGSDTFKVKDYEHDDCRWNIILFAGTNSLPSAPATFNYRKPFFFHGTPIRKESELTKILIDDKTPMIYLPEPYDTEWIDDESSSIAYRSDAMLNFLTQADMEKWQTEDFYNNAINPMVNLWRDFMRELKASNKFYTVTQKSSPTYHAAFGINIRELGTKKLYFSQDLSGVSVKLRLAVYAVDPCLCCGNDLVSISGASYDQAFNNSFDNGYNVAP